MYIVPILSLFLISFYVKSNASKLPISTIITSTTAPDIFRFSAVLVIIVFLIASAVLMIVMALVKCIYHLCKQHWPQENRGYGSFGNGGSYDRSNFNASYSCIKEGPCGLINTNETCYMNSMIQAIASSEVLIRKYDDILLKCPKNENLLKLFVEILKDINSRENTTNCANIITEKLRNLMIHSNWTAQSQQDSFHLFSAVIQAIQQSIRKTLGGEEITLPPKMNILHAFTEDSKFNKVQHHLALALPLSGNFRERPGVQLTSLLDVFFMDSFIDQTTNATKMLLFEHVPDIFVIHIQANEWSFNRSEYVKPKYYIQFTETLTYTFTVPVTMDGTEVRIVQVTFRLTAVVAHMGSVSGGHYVTYRKHCDNWFLANDTQVARTSLTTNIIPYIMVYEKIAEIDLEE